ncbi:phage tail assembly chaperone GT [Peribacillus kribbensis]|uniref:phage tail assembly chaperone GT n=1 Tax=Peribacillus kribbensis TaxID=356658 RepID=UPI00040452B5
MIGWKELNLDVIKNGKDINEVLNMPYHFVIEILRERNKPKRERSLITAFSG